MNILGIPWEREYVKIRNGNGKEWKVIPREREEIAIVCTIIGHFCYKLPVAMHEKVKPTLQHLENLNIIAKTTQPTD